MVVGLASLAVASASPVPPIEKAFLVVGPGPTRPGDRLARERLEARGLAVTLVADDAALTLDADRLTVVSSSAGGKALGARLRQGKGPLLVLQPLLLRAPVDAHLSGVETT